MSSRNRAYESGPGTIESRKRPYEAPSVFESIERVHSLASHSNRKRAYDAGPGIPTRVKLPFLMEKDHCFGVTKLRQFEAEDANKKIKLDSLRTLKTRFEISADPLIDLGYSDGDRKLAKIRYWLSNLGEYTRSADQIVFHYNFLIACLPHIYKGKEWNENGARVMQEFNIDRIPYEVLAQTPRRFGKTYAVAMFVAVLALVCPGIKIVIFSTGSRASQAMLATITKFINLMPGGAERRVKKGSEEHMYAANPLPPGSGLGSAAARAAQDAPDTSSIKAFPAGGDCKYINILFAFKSVEV